MPIDNIKEAKRIEGEFNSLTDDLTRIKYIQKHSDKLFVVLDNDCTFINPMINEDLEQEEQDLISEAIVLDGFDSYCGNCTLAHKMWEALGIHSEDC